MISNTKKHILLVEDDLYARELYHDILTEAGYEVTDAEDGEEALNETEDGKFDLILLDMMMPKVNGLGFLQQLNMNPYYDRYDTPIILFTNLAHDAIIRKAMSLGAQSYLVKSDLSPHQLVSRVQQFLD